MRAFFPTASFTFSRLTNPPNEAQEQATLMRSALSGDAGAMERLLLPHEPMLRAVCRSVLGTGEADIDDAVQETFLRALRGLDRFRAEAKFSTWLTRIAVNVCLNVRRVPRTESWDDASEAETLPARLADVPETAVLNNVWVQAALQTLKPERRVAFVLFEGHGWSMREVGDALGWSIPRVKVELYRTRRSLAAWVREQDAEGKIR